MEIKNELLLRFARVHQIRGSTDEATGLSAILSVEAHWAKSDLSTVALAKVEAGRKALAAAEGVYDDMRRGSATRKYEVDDVLLRAA